MKNILMTLIVLLSSTICSCQVSELKVAIKEHNAQEVRILLTVLDHLSVHDKMTTQVLAKESLNEALNDLTDEQLNIFAQILLIAATFSLPIATCIAGWFQCEQCHPNCGLVLPLILVMFLGISKLCENVSKSAEPEQLKVEAAEAIVQMIKGAKIA